MYGAVFYEYSSYFITASTGAHSTQRPTLAVGLFVARRKRFHYWTPLRNATSTLGPQ